MERAIRDGVISDGNMVALVQKMRNEKTQTKG
jgi:hypothetical protein